MRLIDFLRKHDEQNERFVKTAFKVSDSPGFSVSMYIESYENIFVCDFILDNSIADVQLEYVDAFSIYIDSLLRITQDPKTTEVSLKMIHKISSKKVTIESKEGFGNIVTGIETKPLYDIFEDEDEDETDDLNNTSAFGNLNKYETVEFEPDILEEYESAPEFQDHPSDQDKSCKRGTTCQQLFRSTFSELGSLLPKGQAVKQLQRLLRQLDLIRQA